MTTAETLKAEAIAEARAEITKHLKQAGWSDEKITELFATEIQVISRPVQPKPVIDRKALTIEGIRLKGDATREYHQRMNQVIQDIQQEKKQ